MSKVRVYEIAREFNLESKLVVEKLKAGGLNINGHQSTLNEDDAAKARLILSGKAVSAKSSEASSETATKSKPRVVIRRRSRVGSDPSPSGADESQANQEEKSVKADIVEEPKKAESKAPEEEKKLQDEINSFKAKKSSSSEVKKDDSLKKDEKPLVSPEDSSENVEAKKDEKSLASSINKTVAEKAKSLNGPRAQIVRRASVEESQAVEKEHVKGRTEDSRGTRIESSSRDDRYSAVRSNTHERVNQGP